MWNDHSPEPAWRPWMTLLLLVGIGLGLSWYWSSPDQREAALIRLGLAPAQSDSEAGPQPLPISARSPFHDRRPMDRCRAPTRDTDDVDDHPVYRWRGEHGEWVFSDRPEPAADLEDLSDRYRAREQFARVQVRGEHSRFPAELRSVIGNDVEQMSRVLRDALDLPIRQIDLDIVLYRDRDSFASSSGNASALGRNVSGFYQHGTNQVSILEQPGFKATREVARHEASHAMLAGMYGVTPVWLNEGLAEVMTRLETRGQLRELTVHTAHARSVQRQFQSGGRGALETLLNHDHASWRLGPSTRTYPQAWSLVHELLRHEPGRRLIQAVLAAQEATPCRPIDSIALVQTHFPGGMTGLEQRWLRRARSGDWQAPLRF
ncbi:MAG: hypothetical protein JJU22_15185 [Gammaproteobacteria bacterium]|nr:hypothetical protein [Gammaproteobacteria bacterium]